MRRASSVERIAFTVKEAACALGCSERLVRKEIYSGNIPTFRVGRKVLVPIDFLRSKIEKTVEDTVTANARASKFLDDL